MAKRILALVSALALVLSAAAPAVAEMKIALIIPQKLIAKSKAGQDAAEKLKAKKEAAQKKLDAKAEEVKKQEEDARKRIMMLSPDEKKKVGEDLERQQRERFRLPPG